MKAKFIFGSGLATLIDEDYQKQLDHEASTVSDEANDQSDKNPPDHDALVIFKTKYSWERNTLREILELHSQDHDNIDQNSSPEYMSTIERMMADAFKAGMEFGRQLGVK